VSADFPESAAATAGVWGSLADWWDAANGSGNATQDLLVEPTQERLLDLRSGQIVLDIACGAGRFTLRMAALGAEIVAFDHSGRSLPGPARTPRLTSGRELTTGSSARTTPPLFSRLVRRASMPQCAPWP
jgi:SAM-dependent methyltransferase